LKRPPFVLVIGGLTAEGPGVACASDGLRWYHFFSVPKVVWPLSYQRGQISCSLLQQGRRPRDFGYLLEKVVHRLIAISCPICDALTHVRGPGRRMVPLLYLLAPPPVQKLWLL